MTASVDAIGHLTVIDPQQRSISIDAHGPTVHVAFPDLGSALQAYASFTAQAGAHSLLHMLQRELRRTDLALDFRVRGTSVARLAGDSRGSIAGRMLRLGGTDLRVKGVLRALLGW